MLSKLNQDHLNQCVAWLTLVDFCKLHEIEFNSLTSFKCLGDDDTELEDNEIYIELLELSICISPEYMSVVVDDMDLHRFEYNNKTDRLSEWFLWGYGLSVSWGSWWEIFTRLSPEFKKLKGIR